MRNDHKRKEKNALNSFFILLTKLKKYIFYIECNKRSDNQKSQMPVVLGFKSK